MGMIKGIPVTLYEAVQTGVDAFHAPVFSETPVTVENVLVCPVGADDVVQDLQLYGKRAEYTLCIPKGDTHEWKDRTVEFFGQKWRTFGFATEYIEENLPLDWNLKVKVERFE